MNNKYKNKKTLVCGMARSGMSSAVLLKRLGANVTLQDIKTPADIKPQGLLETAREYGINLYLGKNPDDILDRFELIVVSPGIPCDLPFFKKAAQLGIELIGEVELAYSVCENKIAAITGTNGKTTTTALLGEIMKNHIPGSETVGNIGVPFSEKVIGLNREAYIVAEISSFQLETVKTFKPHIAIILNVTPDHLNRHYTLENYAALKQRIFSNQGLGDYAVINYDDILCRDMACSVKSKAMFFSRKQPLKDGVYVENGKVYINNNNKIDEILNTSDINMPGAHFVEDVIAAIAAGVCAGVPLGVIRDTVTKFKSVEHRIEFVAEINGVKYYNDSKATNTDSAIKALEAFEQPVVLIGGGQDKSADFTQWVKMFDGRVKHLFIIGETGWKIKNTCDMLGFFNYSFAENMEEAINGCYEKASAGNCVLLSPACASFDMFDSYEHRGDAFKRFVKDLINNA